MMSEFALRLFAGALDRKALRQLQPHEAALRSLVENDLLAKYVGKEHAPLGECTAQAFERDLKIATDLLEAVKWFESVGGDVTSVLANVRQSLADDYTLSELRRLTTTLQDALKLTPSDIEWLVSFVRDRFVLFEAFVRRDRVGPVPILQEGAPPQSPSSRKPTAIPLTQRALKLVLDNTLHFVEKLVGNEQFRLRDLDILTESHVVDVDEFSRMLAPVLKRRGVPVDDQKLQQRLKVVFVIPKDLRALQQLDAIVLCLQTYELKVPPNLQSVAKAVSSTAPDTSIDEANRLLLEIQRDLPGLKARVLQYFERVSQAKELVTFLCSIETQDENTYERIRGILNTNMQGNQFVLQLLLSLDAARHLVLPLVHQLVSKQPFDLKAMLTELQRNTDELSDADFNVRLNHLSTVCQRLPEVRISFARVSDSSTAATVPFIMRLLETGQFRSLLPSAEADEHVAGLQLSYVPTGNEQSQREPVAHSSLVELELMLKIFMEGDNVSAQQSQHIQHFLEALKLSRNLHQLRLESAEGRSIAIGFACLFVLFDLI
jgi:hypothetical protein